MIAQKSVFSHTVSSAIIVSEKVSAKASLVADVVAITPSVILGCNHYVPQSALKVLPLNIN